MALGCEACLRDLRAKVKAEPVAVGWGSRECPGSKLLSRRCWAPGVNFPKDHWTRGASGRTVSGRMPRGGGGGNMTQQKGPHHGQEERCLPFQENSRQKSSVAESLRNPQKRSPKRSRQCQPGRTFPASFFLPSLPTAVGRRAGRVYICTRRHTYTCIYSYIHTQTCAHRHGHTCVFTHQLLWRTGGNRRGFLTPWARQSICMPIVALLHPNKSSKLGSDLHRDTRIYQTWIRIWGFH